MTASSPEFGLHDILARLVESGVEFVVCGGVACLVHGVSRSTAGLDCAVRLDDRNLLALVDALRPLGYRLRGPEPVESLASAERRAAWIAEKHATAATLLSERSPVQVDVFLRYPIAYDDLRRDAVATDLHGNVVRVSSIEHLIEAKRSTVPQREVDRRDVEDLSALRRRHAP